MNKKLMDIGEFGLINKIAKQFKTDESVIKGIGDDCAVVKLNKDKYLLLTTDILIEDVHFELKNASFQQIGWKALAVNISDIAAMGGVPTNALISIGVPSKLSVKAVDEIYKGIKKIAQRFKINIVGGDMSKAGKLIINVSLSGEVKKKNLVKRDGAKDRDIIFVTGTLGGSIYGKHLNFTPRVDEAQILLKNFRLNSMIDLSDGISSDLTHIIKQSNVGAVIYEELLPIAKEAKSRDEALNMGEDFELLFTLTPWDAKSLLLTKPKKIKIPITQIGAINKKSTITLITKNNQEKIIEPVGFKHF